MAYHWTFDQIPHIVSRNLCENEVLFAKKSALESTSLQNFKSHLFIEKFIILNVVGILLECTISVVFDVLQELSIENVTKI